MKTTTQKTLSRWRSSTLVISAMALCTTAIAGAPEQPSAMARLNALFDHGQAGDFSAKNLEANRSGTVKVNVRPNATVSVASTKAIRLTYYLPMFASSGEQDYQTGLKALRDAVTQACDEQSGQVDLTAYRGRSTAVTKLAINTLQDQKLIGDFACLTASGRTFAVSVQPVAQEVSKGLLSTGWDFYVNALYLDGQRMKEAETQAKEQLEQQKNAEAEQAAANQKFRSSLQPGMQASVSSSEVPPDLLKALAARYRMFTPGKQTYQVCALVIDTKPSLVQVQVSDRTFYVPSTAVSPFTRALVHNDIVNWATTNTNDWCLGK